jgi:hypothetical protein
LLVLFGGSAGRRAAFFGYFTAALATFLIGREADEVKRLRGAESGRDRT